LHFVMAALVLTKIISVLSRCMRACRQTVIFEDNWICDG
jgi:hypothetical protein